MAHTLRLSYGGSTINFNSGSITLRNYVPNSPNLSTIDSNSILSDGGRRTLISRRNVAEGCQVLVKPSSGAASDITGAKQKIQQWLIDGERYQETLVGSPVYIEYAPDGLSASIYRSEILGGKVEIADNSLDTRWTQNRAVELDIAWTRNYYWEGNEITLPLFNSGCTSTCATITNQNPLDFTGQSGCYNNWVQIAASNVIGEIESPATIEIHNMTGDISSPELHIFHGIGNYITSFPSTLEAESGVWSSGSVGTSACVSSGSYNVIPISNITSWANAGYWVLSSASLRQWSGKYINVMGAFYGEPSASLFARLKLADNQVSGFVEISVGQTMELKTINDLQTLGTIQLPTNIITSEDILAEQRLYLQYKNFRSASTTINLDCIYLVPTDGYRYIKQQGFIEEATDYIIDRGYSDSVLLENVAGGGGKLTIVTWKGNPINIIPNKDQRLYILQQDASDYDPFRIHGVKVKYRPRRLTI